MARTQSPDYDERRGEIVDRSARLFAEKGFHATSVAEIAARCNASKSRLYHYFGAKEDILAAVMEDHVALLAEIARAADRESADAETKLARIANEFMKTYVGARDRHVVLLNEIGNLPKARRDRLIELQREIVAIIGRILAAINPKAFEDPSRIAPATMLFMGMMNWTHTWYDPKGPLKREDLADLLARIAISGIKGL